MNSDHNLTTGQNDFTLASKIRLKLEPGEKLLWVGRPVSLLSHARNELQFYWFGLLFFGGSILWTYIAYQDFQQSLLVDGDRTRLWIPMAGIPFMLVGSALVMVPVWAMIDAAGTVYAVTRERLLISHFLPWRKTQIWQIGDLKFLTLDLKREELGSIFFDSVAIDTHEDGTVTYRKIGFIGINSPIPVLQLIRKQMNSVETKL